MIFDLDNTLADRDAAVAAWLAEFSRQHGLSAADREWILEMDNDGYSDRRAVFEAIRERLGLPEPVDRLVADYQRRVVELAVPVPGAVECLRQMRGRGWTLAMVTNGSSGQQHGKIDALGLREFFEVIFVSGDVGVKKPASEIFEMAAEGAGLPLRGAWMVGDSPTNDVDGGGRLGMKTAWITRGRTWPDDLAPPTVSVDRLAELVDAMATERSVIALRPSTIDDIPELQEVELDAGAVFREIGLDTIADDDPPDPSILSAHVRAGTAWTAELDSVVVGYAIASVVDDEAHLDQVSVRRAAAGRGIGRRLIDEVCRWAVDEGYEALTLTTFTEVPWNGPYYERLGFEPLPADRCGPRLNAIREEERRSGIDVSPRAAMRLPLDRWVPSDSSGRTG